MQVRSFRWCSGWDHSLRKLVAKLRPWTDGSGLKKTQQGLTGKWYFLNPYCFPNPVLDIKMPFSGGDRRIVQWFLQCNRASVRCGWHLKECWPKSIWWWHHSVWEIQILLWLALQMINWGPDRLSNLLKVEWPPKAKLSDIGHSSSDTPLLPTGQQEDQDWVKPERQCLANLFHSQLTKANNSKHQE